MATTLYRGGRVHTPDPFANALVVDDGRRRLDRRRGGRRRARRRGRRGHRPRRRPRPAGVRRRARPPLADRGRAARRRPRGHHLGRRGAAPHRGRRAPPRRPTGLRPQLAGARLGRAPGADRGRAGPGDLRWGRLSPRVDGHSAVISSALAAVSGADRLPGWEGDGLVTRDAKHAARAAFDAARSPAQRREDIELALRAAAARGIGVVHESGGPLLSGAEDFAEVLELGGAPTCRAPSATGPRPSPTPSRPGTWSPCTAPPASPATSTSTGRSARAPPTCARTTPTTRGAEARPSGRAPRSATTWRRARPPASRAASTSSATRGWTPCSTATRPPPPSSGSTPSGRPAPGSSTPRWSTPRASPGWRGSGWSRASSRSSTPSGAGPRGCTRRASAGSGCRARTRSPRWLAAGVRLALGSDSPGHAVRPLGHRARGRRAPRGRTPPRHGGRVRRPHRRRPPGRPRGRGRGPAGRRPGDVRRVGRAGDRSRRAAPRCEPGRRCRPVGSPCATAWPCTGRVDEPADPGVLSHLDRSCCLRPVVPKCSRRCW